MDEEKKFDQIIPVDLQDEMKKSYIDYAMSVIVSRALPDVRDGLKPVQRRILYSMIELNLTPDKPYRKSARIVGDTMGKYHPHGDSSIYDAMVRMAQPFSYRKELVDGHGNFGSVDGDSPAAMRYTEARLSKMALEMIADINKDTVEYYPNFDESLKQPTVLPARYPNLLVNGASGIAVGMATNIPPHNINEVIDAVVHIMDNRIDLNKETDIEELLEIISGPDFPTGAQILGKAGIAQAYRTGRGKVKVRGVTDIEQMSPTKSRIIVTELPFQVNKARMIEKIANLVKEKKITGISDIRDESDRTGMRVVIELKRDANPNVILNLLYKHTQLQDTFGVNMLALVNNEPKVLNLKQVLDYYLEHQIDVVTRRTKYELRKAEARAHILEGLIKALDVIDEIIKIIRSSYDDAKAKLIERFDFSDIQAQAILDMRLKRLSGLEREKLEKEYLELMEKIKELNSILANPNLLLKVIREEILIIKEKFGDERRTEITYDDSEISIEDMIKEESTTITMTHLGYIKRLPVATYKSQNRGGKGIKGMQTRDDDFVENIFITSTHHYLLFFTNKGKVYRLKAYEIPEASRTARGTAIVNLLQLEPGETISAVIPLKEYKEGINLLMATKDGLIKKTSIMAYINIRIRGIQAITLRDGDSLIEVKLTNNEDEKVILGTKIGQCIMFNIGDVRETGRTSIGVKGITLKSDDDEVIGMQMASQGSDVLVVSENGKGKRTKIENFTPQNRGGKGVKFYKITTHTGNVVGMKIVSPDNELILITTEGIIIRIRVKDISQTGRVTSGVKLMDLKETIQIASIARIKEIDHVETDEDEEKE